MGGVRSLYIARAELLPAIHAKTRVLCELINDNEKRALRQLTACSPSQPPPSASLLHTNDLPGNVAADVDKHARKRGSGVVRDAVVVHDAHEFRRREFCG